MAICYFPRASTHRNKKMIANLVKVIADGRNAVQLSECGLCRSELARDGR